jgi:hypothetical protein
MVALARCRCSCHKLTIEMGRQNNIPLYERICLFCFNQNNVTAIDCEFHAFFQCSKYNDVRNNYLYNWYSNGTTINDFYSLMSTQNEENIYKLSLFVYHLLKSTSS